jgi:hypothetical protein
MESIIIVIWKIIIGLGAYLIVVVPIIMEFAVNRKQVRAPGEKLQIKEDGFVVRQIYMNNVMNGDEEKSIPKNTCRLYWGTALGGVWSPTITTLAIIIMCILGIGGFLLGFIIDLNPKTGFHDFERYGKNNEKKFIAPWKIIIPLLAVIYYKITWEVVTILVDILSSKIMIYIYAVIVLVVVVTVAINKVRKKEIWIATKEVLKAIDKKICIDVEGIKTKEQ